MDKCTDGYILNEEINKCEKIMHEASTTSIFVVISTEPQVRTTTPKPTLYSTSVISTEV